MIFSVFKKNCRWLIIVWCIFSALRSFAMPADCKITLLTATLNHQSGDDIKTFILCKKTGLLAQKTDLSAWHFQLPQQAATVIDNTEYFPLRAFPNLHYQINEQNLSLAIDAPTSLFTTQQLSLAANNSEKAIYPTPGVFLNYDLETDNIATGWDYNALFDIGAFNAMGTGTFDFFVRHSPNQTKTIRLSTLIQKDNIDKMQTLRLGDSITMPGMWGYSVSFGGVQWATNFGTQPDFVTFPLPIARGQAVVPTTLNIYVNNALVASRNVPVGPFAIQSIPVVTGQGQIRLVETDLFGRQRTVDIPYYMNNQLLKPGLHDFSYSVGAIRQNYGIDSFNYSDLLFTGTDTIGLSENFSGQWHAEVVKNQQNVGVGGIWLVSKIGVVSGGVSVSRRQQFGEGGLLLVKFDRQLQKFSLGCSNQFTTPRYSQLGLQLGALEPTMQNQAYVGYSFDNQRGTIGAVFTNVMNRGSASARLFSMNYSKNLFHGIYLNLAGLTNIGGQNSKALYATLSMPLGVEHSVNVGGTLQQKASSGTVQLSKNLPIGNGYGYSLFANEGQGIHEVRGSFALQKEFGSYNLQGDWRNGLKSYQLDTQGSIILIDEHLHFAQQINDSFAVIQVPGYQGVGVYENNQLIGQTDKHGDVVLPHLTSYQNNPIAIDAQSLPLNSLVTTLKKNVIPYYRSGVLVKYNVRPARAGILSIVLASGEALPTDAIVKMNDQAQTYPVGYNGQVYMTDLQAQNQVHVSWQSNHCDFTVNYPETAEPIPNLGTFTCGASSSP
jgi:outer membrane usher protein